MRSPRGRRRLAGARATGSAPPTSTSTGASSLWPGARGWPPRQSCSLAEMRPVFHRMADPTLFLLPYLEQNAEIAGLLEREPATAARRLASYLVAARDQLVAALAATH